MRNEHDKLMTYYMDYMYHRAVEDMSRGRLLEGKSPINTRDATLMRDRVDEIVKKKGTYKDGVSPLNGMIMIESIDEAFNEKYGEGLFGDSNFRENPLYQEYSRDFLNLTGFDSVVAKEGKGSYLPISSFSKTFRERFGLLNRGGELQYIKAEDVDKHLGDVAAGFDDGSKKNLVKQTRCPLYRRLEDGFIKTSYRFCDRDDLTGLSKFYGYMTNEEYMSTRDWVNAAVDFKRPDWRNQLMSDGAVDRAQAILNYLKEDGVDFTIQPDSRPGQIMCKLDGTGIRVRLMDTGENGRFVGRVYDDGAQMYYTTTDRRQGAAIDENVLTPEDAVNLVRFARGESVEGAFGQFGENGTYRKRYKSGFQMLNRSFNSGTSFSTATRDIGNQKMMLRVDYKSRSASSRFFAEEGEALEFIEGSIAATKDRIHRLIDREGLMQAHEQMVNGAGDFVFSGDPFIAGVQKSYWALLNGEPLEGPNGEVFEGDPIEAMAQHEEAFINHYVGSMEPSLDGRFSPEIVARYMDDNDYMRNVNDLVAALQKADIRSEELRSFGESTLVRNKLISFKPETAEKMKDKTSDFMKASYETIVSSLKETGAVVDEDSILIDENGIVRYEVERAASERTNTKMPTKKVEGYIGQLFEPENGMVQTKFAANNHMFVPGYMARVVSGEGTVEERTRLMGYQEAMMNQIRYQIRSDSFTTRTTQGLTTSLNSLYGHLYDTRFDLDFYEKSAEEGLSPSWRDAILKTEASRVRYPKSIRESATIHAAYQEEAKREWMLSAIDNPYMVCIEDVNNRSVLQNMDYRNMSLLTKESDGYFDPIITGGSTNQGITRYLISDAKVEDGRIVPGNPESRVALLEHPDSKFMSFDPFDRQQMVGSNLLQSSAITADVGVANMTFGGWTMDDGIVISKDMAERYPVRRPDGDMRPLMIGDKLSDFHGNKGVIAQVIDRDMTRDEAELLGLSKEVEIFKDNPGLDVVMAPFPSVSRFNGGSTRELMRDVEDLSVNDGTVSGGIGHGKFMVTHMSVDNKTKVYEEEDILQGKGRKASGQLAWALTAQDCPNIMREFYGDNIGATTKLREFLITCGLDLGELGEIENKYIPHVDEERLVFDIPELKYYDNGGLDKKGMVHAFSDTIGMQGGFLRIPFELDYPSYDMKGSIKEYHKLQKDGDGYLLPIMSHYLRSDVQTVDGDSVAHAYTNAYLKIYEQSVLYLDAKERLKDASSDTKKKYEDIIAMSQYKCQRAFDGITSDVVSRRFEGKHNVVRDDIMSNRLEKSSTAVWSANPHLDIDQVAMGDEMMASLGVSEDDYVCVWRDPILRDSGLRYMRIKREPDLVGVQINPVSDKSFDGDFDGDSVGIVALQSRLAREEALEKLTHGANLLEYGSKREDGLYDLNFQNALDLKVAQHDNPAFAERWEELTVNVNEFEAAYKKREIGFTDLVCKRNYAVKQLSDLVRESFDTAYGTAIQYDSMESHLKSVEHACIETGAKGNIKKLRNYMQYLGVTDGLEEGDINYDGLKDEGKTLAGRKEHEATQYAVAVKAFGTGIAGGYSQRAVKALRGTSAKAAMELTYPATQSVLQSKHDPIEAAKKYDALMSAARSIWRGEAVEYDGDKWKVARDKNGAVIKNSKGAFVKNMMDYYSHPDGLNVPINEEYVEIVANALEKDGEIRSIESEEVLQELASPMDRLAYGGNFDMWNTMAKSNTKLFDGKSHYFAPRALTRNEVAFDRMTGLSAIKARDVEKRSPRVVVPKVEEPKVEVEPDLATTASYEMIEAEPESDMEFC